MLGGRAFQGIAVDWKTEEVQHWLGTLGDLNLPRALLSEIVPKVLVIVFMCGGVLPAYRPVHCVHAVLVEARRRHQIL